ncbi:MAG TPA: GNAT family N-acetyltransferase, partial [Thermoanaerobaculia bacterium]|nr:GNAT family N-acetyltransferase [Thermoanaerobaculia bacterium]
MIEVRAARPEDTAEILALFRTCFGHERSAAEWHWKYALAPHGAASWVAVADGALIAHYGGVRQECHAGGRPFVGYQGVDIMTHPDWRARVFARRGVLVRLAEAFFAAHPMDAYFGFPSQRHARLNRLLLGYEDHRPVGQLRQSVAQRDGVTGDGGAEPAEWDSLDAAALDRLWRTCRRRLALSLEKGSRYLFWRYRDRPGHRYEVLSAGGWLGRLDGIAVLALAGEEVRLL